MTRPAKLGFAALSALLFAFPAAAKDRAAPRVSGTPSPPLSRNRLAPPASRDNFASLPLGAQIPVVGDLSLGVGMFSVTGAFLKDRGARGREAMIGTAGQQSRVAAVGLSLHF